MTQSTGFDTAGQGSSGTDWRNTNSSSGAGSFSGREGTGHGADFDQHSSDNQGWMPESFGGGQAGDMLESVRDFGRNNRAATIGGGILAILALAGYASSTGKRRQEQRYRGDWQSSGRDRDDDRFRREDYRGSRGQSRGSFFGSDRGSYGSGRSSYGGLRRAGRYGMNHPLGLTAGAALGAMALSWLARGWGQNGGQSGNWQGSQGSFGGQGFQGSQGFQGGQDFQGGQGAQGGQTGMTGSGSSFSGSTSAAGTSGFGDRSSGSQSFGSGRMGSDAIEAAGSSSDIGQGTTGSSSGRGRTGTTAGL